MGKVTGFLEYGRKTHRYKEVKERIKNFNEFIDPLSSKKLENQAARCMDCGTPFCHTGCPLGNIIPDFNDFVYRKDYYNAFLSLKSTNNFPSITGRICPAPCESACVLGINQPPVSIKSIEYTIGDKAWKNGWEKPNSPQYRTQHKVAIVGSGPAGLACADHLNMAGHWVTVYERDDHAGGLLTYGIPNFKLNKKVVFREIDKLEKEGVKFILNCEIGKDISLTKLKKDNDVVVLAVGSTMPRDLSVENRDSNQVFFAMDFLKQATGKLLKSPIQNRSPKINVKGKRVLVIGGGDTGSDCIGTSIRQGCKSVTQIEILPQPPKVRDETMPWPLYDRIFRISSSQEEGCDRKFSMLTKKLLNDERGILKGVEYVTVEWSKDLNKFEEKDHPKILPTDVILLAMGFTGPEKSIANGTSLQFDERGNFSTLNQSYYSGVSGFFVCGDARRGQSLVVWAISEGRECAIEVDEFLIKNRSQLKSKERSFYQTD